MRSKGILSGGTGPITQAASANATSILKLVIPAGEASPGPPIGPALGQKGIKAIDFCKSFNEQSLATYRKGTPLRCRIAVTSDRKFSFQVRPPATMWLLKQVTGVSKASSRFTVARIAPQIVYEIARVKAMDPFLHGRSLDGIYRMILATAKSCGFQIIK